MEIQDFAKKYKPHPSFVLIMDIDEEFDTHDIRLEIDRCYSYLGTPLIRTHARAKAPKETADISHETTKDDVQQAKSDLIKNDEDADITDEDADSPENILRMMVNLGTRHYLYSKDEGADELWEEIIKPWLHHQLYKISNQTQIYNRRQREIGSVELPFTYFEVLLESGSFLIRFRLDSRSAMPESESVWVSRIRDALNSGALGVGATQIELPTKASYKVQYREGMKAKALREEQAALEAQRAAEEEDIRTQEAEDAAEAAFLESPTLQLQAKEKAFVESIKTDLVTQARIAELNTSEYSGETPVEGSEQTAEEIVAERVEQEANIPEYLEKKYALPDADFALDYHLWQVSYTDGSTKTFDFEQGTLADETAEVEYA